MKTPQSSAVFRLAVAVVCAAGLCSCSTFPVQSSWHSKSAALPRGLVVELGPVRGGISTFRIRGDELGGATLTGEARPQGGGWSLEIARLDFFSNWAEGWTEATFAAEGELELRPAGASWVLEVHNQPTIENPISASIRLYGDYFEGDKALALLAHRWDRIQAADELLKQKFPDAWYDYSEPRKIRFWWDLFARRVANFQQGVRTFLFPELYGYPKTSPSTDGGPFVRAESIGWDTNYTKAQFPENLRAIRDSGTMYRDFEESASLWRLDFSWEALWAGRIRDVAFMKK